LFDRLGKMEILPLYQNSGRMVFLQPCDWIESDSKFKYVVDIFGRTQTNEVAKVRLTGFCPYFYVRNVGGTAAKLAADLENKGEKRLFGMKITEETKLDAMRGFSGLKPIKVWKLSFPALWMMKFVLKTLKRMVHIEDIFEADLPPLLRLFHERDISPASVVQFEADEYDPEDDDNVDVYYVLKYDEVSPALSVSIPLYVSAYDIETYSDSGRFPSPKNATDEVIQIGLSFRFSNKMLETHKRFVFVSGTCEPSQDSTVTFVSCQNERDLLDKFQRCIRLENPDIISGYNTFGFDDPYIADRCERLHLHLNLGRSSKSGEYAKTVSKTFELASGKFEVRYLDMPGRLAIDLLLSVRREHNLDSYKLDNVSTVFLRDKVTEVKTITGQTNYQYEIHTKSTKGLFMGNMVRFDIVTNTINPYSDAEKFTVKEVKSKSFIVESDRPILDELSKDELKKLEWSFTKDDITAKEMFASHRGTAADRSKIAKYCIQDCDLVLTLMSKLDTIVNARGMADVCHVPIQYIFLRGQGIKIYSTVVYNASKRNQILMMQNNETGDMSYEGAIVLPPKIGMYLDQPIPVLDFNSLYPSNMIAYNLSPDTLVYVKTFNERGKKIDQQGPDTIEGYKIDEISYDTKDPPGRITCGFVQPEGNSNLIGVLPLTLGILLKKRKETRKLMETAEDKSVLNGLQLAYKVVANSVYGQTGSRTSSIRKVEIAACTTAAGRDRLQFAKKIVEEEFGAEVVYGDTDSIFVKFPTKDLSEAIELGKKSADRITELCRSPYKIEYEKTFFPFILFCRKRYVGMKYENDPKQGKRVTMGVALKRRDNAPIVKDVFGGALDILIEQKNIRSAQTFVKDLLVQVMQNKIPLDKYIITKQLRDDYKNPEQIAHRVLADRMEERDAGNKPQVGDRLSFIFVADRTGKQGDRIEHIDYVKEHKLKPDVDFYITNQIQKPVAQLFALAIEELEGYTTRTAHYSEMYKGYLETMDEEEATLKVLSLKEKELEKLLFIKSQYLMKHKRGPMDIFIKRG